MALQINIMKQGFLPIFGQGNTSSRPKNPREAANRMAKVYANYARTALAGPNTPAFTGAEERTLANILYPAIADPRSGNPARFANAWQSGFTAFWFAPPVRFTGSNTGAVVSAPGGVAIAPCLIPVFANIRNSSKDAADRIARCLDIATKTIIYFSPIPPPSGFTTKVT